MDNRTNQHDKILNVFMKACEYHEAGNYQPAESLYTELLAIMKGNWLLHYNFGLLLFETDRAPEALNHFLRASSLETSSNDVFFNLALCQKKCGLYESAVISYKKALDLVPDDFECHYNLANCFLAINRSEEAISHYKTVLKIDPMHQAALNNLAYSYHKAGIMDQATRYYKKLLEINPGHTSADHMLASLTGKTRSSAPLSYVQEVFDNYSTHYEDSLLHKLQYTLPENLQSFIARSTGKKMYNRVIDIGCGTGLLGETLRNVTQVLHGIDLSPKMIEIANKKGLYDNLMTGDIHEVAGTLEKESYDLLVAADVLNYIGEFIPTLKVVYSLASPDSFFFFSVENLKESDKQILLRESGRFAHSQNYVEQATQQTGWRVVSIDAIDLRKERGIWIEGAVYGIKKNHMK